MCPTAAYAEAYDPTPMTAVQILAKADAASGKLDSGAFIEKRIEHYGGVDYTVTTLINGDDFRTTFEGGGFVSSYGRYQGRGWESNENGIVTIRSGFHAESNPNAVAVKHPNDPNSHVSVLGLTQTEPQEYAIDINPHGGVDEHLYYNARTFLLDREVRFERDRYRHVTDYSDYREAFGSMIAQHVHSYDGRPQNDGLETLVSHERTSSAPDLAIPASKQLFTVSGDAPVVLPATFSSSGIIIRAQIGGRGYDFLLDSGADGLVIDPRVVHELGLTPFGRSSVTVGGGDVDNGNVRIPQISIGPLQLRDVVFTASPIDETTDKDARVVGLIGFDFLASAITGVDFKAKTLTLYPRSSFKANTPGLMALPMQLDDGVPRVDAAVEGVPGHFLIDTGAFSMLAYRDYVGKLPSAPRDPQTTAIGTVGGDMAAIVLHLSDFSFGGILFRSADFIEPAGSTFDELDYDGIIGRNALSVYQVYFDYPDGILFLRQNI